MDAKYIVGLKDELFFLGCGYNRTMVRSYHIGRKEWTARGTLRHEHKESCFKAVVLNGSIYVVMCKIVTFSELLLVISFNLINNSQHVSIQIKSTMERNFSFNDMMTMSKIGSS